MGFDIKEKISEIINKIKSDKGLMDKFKASPEKTVEELIGVDIPDGMLEKVVDGVKSGVALDKAKDALGSIKKLF